MNFYTKETKFLSGYKTITWSILSTKTNSLIFIAKIIAATHTTWITKIWRLRLSITHSKVAGWHGNFEISWKIPFLK